MLSGRENLGQTVPEVECQTALQKGTHYKGDILEVHLSDQNPVH